MLEGLPEEQVLERTFGLQNMLSKSCIKLIELYFQNIEEVDTVAVFLGEVRLRFDRERTSENKIVEQLAELGFPVLNDPEMAILEKAKIAAIELIHYANNTDGLIRNSDYIAERVQEPYDKISKVFSKITGSTLEKYIIRLKIEKAKELILGGEYTLSEISYMLGYSSVQYLSNQFKKITGVTVSEFKNQSNPERTPLEQIVP